MTRVAFLGLGAMGRPMAGRLVAAGHAVTVWNRTPGRDDELVAAGAVRAATPADAGRDAEAAITMVADPVALERVLFGPDGLGAALRHDATLIDTSTVGPTAIRSAAERLRPVTVLDAPVMGSVPHAEAGTLQILVGGDAAVLERHREVLAALGSVTHVGGPGAGATLKLVNNAASISSLVAVGEVLAFAERAGIDPDAVLDGLALGPLASMIERWRARILGTNQRADFRLALARKDLGLLVDEAATIGIDPTVPRAVARRLEAAEAAGLGDRDLGAVVAHVRDLA